MKSHADSDNFLKSVIARCVRILTNLINTLMSESCLHLPNHNEQMRDLGRLNNRLTLLYLDIIWQLAKIRVFVKNITNIEAHKRKVNTISVTIPIIINSFLK